MVLKEEKVTRCVLEKRWSLSLLGVVVGRGRGLVGVGDLCHMPDPKPRCGCTCTLQVKVNMLLGIKNIYVHVTLIVVILATELFSSLFRLTY